MKVANSYSRILVTGGSGFIGTNLVQAYREAGAVVLNLSDREPLDKRHRDCWRQADVRDDKLVSRIFEEFEPELLVHLAARTDLQGARVDSYSANTDGVSNVIRAANVTRSLRRAIYASSRLVCEIGHRPKTETDYSATTAYGKSKIIGERLVRERAGESAPWVIVRPTSIWGPWFDVPYRGFFEAIARGFYVHPRGVRVLKSFGYVGNAVFQIRALAEAPTRNVHERTMFLADYQPLELGEFADAIARRCGRGPNRRVPHSLLRLGALGGDVLSRFGVPNPPLTTFRLNNLTTEMLYDLDPLETIAGDLPYTLSKGVERTVAWLQDSSVR